MKKIILISLLLFLSNCTGYKPIFTSDQTNFYIEKIEISDDSKHVRKLIKSLKPYSVDNGKQSITLKLDLDKQENVIMKDAKGDPASYEIKIELKVDIITTILGAAPGGISGMSLVGSEYGVGPAVATLHAVRLITVLLIMPLIVKILNSLGIIKS